MDTAAGLLKHPDWKQRVKGLQLVSKQPSIDMARLLKDDRFAQCLNDIEPAVRTAALGVLALMGSRSLPLATQVVQRLQDRDWEVREAATRALGAMGDGARVVSVQVATLLRSNDPGTQLAAVEACAAMGAVAGAAAEQLAGLLVKSDSEWVKSSTYVALSKMGARGAVFAHEVMNKGFRDPDKKDRESAVDCIVGMKAEAATFLGPLVGHFRDRSPTVRACACKALSKLGRLTAAPHIDLILELLDDADWRVRLTAVEAVGDLTETWNGEPDREGKDDIGWLLAVAQRLWDESFDVRSAAQSLTEKMMNREKDAGRKYALVAQVAAAQGEDEEKAPEWKESVLGNFVATGFTAEDLWAKLACVEAIASLGSKGGEFAPALGAMQNSTNLRVKDAVRRALGGMGPPGEFELVRQVRLIPTFFVSSMWQQ